jgi:hypothetical protein
MESAVRGLTDAEALWQTPGFALEPREPPCPPPGTILWQYAHIAGCNRHYLQVLRHRPAQEVPAVLTTPQPASLAAVLDELRASHNALRAEVANITETEPSAGCGDGAADVGDFLAACLRHETWDAGQVSLIRWLYRAT